MEQILLTPIETLNVVKGIDKAWRGYTDDYAIHEGIAKAQLKKVVDKVLKPKAVERPSTGKVRIILDYEAYMYGIRYKLSN